MDVKAKAYIKHGGEWHKEGEKFTVKREDGDALVARGLVVETELSAEKHKEALAKKQADAEAKKAADEKAKAEAEKKAKAEAAAKKQADEKAKAKAEAEKENKKGK